MPTRKVLIPKPLDHQRDLLLDDHRFKVVCCGRRWGKTMAGLMAVLIGHGPASAGIGSRPKYKGALYGGTIWWVAPTFQIAAKIWRDLKACFRNWDDIDKNEVEKRIDLPGGGSISVKSAHDPDALRGEGLDGLVMDEAAFAAKEAWSLSLRAALADKQGWAIFITTPNGRNWFYDLFRKAQGNPEWNRWQRPTSDNPKIPVAELDSARIELGEAEFSRECGAEFLAVGGGVFKPQLQKFYTRRSEDGWISFHGDSAVPQDPRNLMKFGTADLAASTKTYSDYSVIASWAVTHDGKLILLDVVRGKLDGPALMDALRTAWQRNGLSTIAVEKTAFHVHLIDLARAQGIPIQEVPVDRDKVTRAYPAAAAMERGKVWFPEQAHWLTDFQDELFSFPTADVNDDQVDTLSYAVHIANYTSPIRGTDSTPTVGSGTPRQEPDWWRQQGNRKWGRFGIEG
jgi:predicted phage terminase large subunit-like protein